MSRRFRFPALLVTALLLAASLSRAQAQGGCLAPNPTRNVTVTGNLDAGSAVVSIASIPSVTATSTTAFADLGALAGGTTDIQVFDTLGAAHTLSVYAFRTGTNTWIVRAYVRSQDVDMPVGTSGLPRPATGADITLIFDGSGVRTNPPASGSADQTLTITWNNGSASSSIGLRIAPVTQLSAASSLGGTADGSTPVSCTPTPTPTVTSTPTITPTSTPTPTPSSTMTAAPSPTIPPTVAPTATIPPTPTVSPVPTFAPPTATAAPRELVTGRVTPPVAGALVLVFGSSDGVPTSLLAATRTDAEGAFAVEVVEGGELLLVPRLSGAVFDPERLVLRPSESGAAFVSAPEARDTTGCSRTDEGNDLLAFSERVVSMRTTIASQGRRLIRRSSARAANRRIVEAVNARVDSASGSLAAPLVALPTDTIACPTRPECVSERFPEPRSAIRRAVRRILGESRFLGERLDDAGAPSDSARTARNRLRRAERTLPDRTDRCPVVAGVEPPA
jgi:hypothetical protein